ncbi:MAG TPA: glycosyltransferase family 4 protein [Solirubrobacteraceae bacterium]|nr:glycosyltransferase family 4 protein [Solirubrobacteraceae bacterium]
MQPTVLHILPHRGGGAETYLDALKALPLTQRRMALSVSRSPLGAAPSIIARWPRVAAASGQADLVHVHGDVASMLSLPMMRARPSLLTTHGLHFVRRSKGARLALARHGLRAAVAASNRTICTSDAEREELSEFLPATLRARLVVIPNTAPPAAGATDRASARAELDLSPEVVVALFIGQLEERKDPLAAVAAATAAATAGAPLVLLVAGAGPLDARVRALAGPAVRVLGYRDDPQTLLAAADLLVMPSRREGQSIAVLEAMRDGLAVVVSDGAGNPELVADAGEVVPAGDAEALAAVLVRLAADSGERRRLGAAARLRYAEHYSLERFQARMAELYGELLGTRLEGW